MSNSNYYKLQREERCVSVFPNSIQIVLKWSCKSTKLATCLHALALQHKHKSVSQMTNVNWEPPRGSSRKKVMRWYEGFCWVCTCNWRFGTSKFLWYVEDLLRLESYTWLRLLYFNTCIRLDKSLIITIFVTYCDSFFFHASEWNYTVPLFHSVLKPHPQLCAWWSWRHRVPPLLMLPLSLGEAQVQLLYRVLINNLTKWLGKLVIVGDYMYEKTRHIVTQH